MALFYTNLVFAYEGGGLTGEEALELSGTVSLLCLYELAADEFEESWRADLSTVGPMPGRTLH